MASPHVAGTVALLWSAAPALRGDIAATREILDLSAVDVDDTRCGGTAAKNNTWGEGRLDAHRAALETPTGRVGGLSGTVTSGGAPVPQADLPLTGPMNRKLATGQNGTYALPSLKTGTCRISARKLGCDEASATVIVAADTTVVQDVAMTALPAHTVAGTVTFGGGPQSDVEIRVAGTSTGTVTDSTGRYRLAVPAGTYELDVIPPHAHCAGPVKVPVAVGADMTRDVVLPSRTDHFGYTCAEGNAPYIAGSDRLPIRGAAIRHQITLPFPVMHYGATYDSAWLGVDGWLSFLREGVRPPINRCPRMAPRPAESSPSEMAW
nr:carboxypeptidase regulatory-like domain-containing protein [Sinosporangium siamense]